MSGNGSRTYGAGFGGAGAGVGAGVGAGAGAGAGAFGAAGALAGSGSGAGAGFGAGAGAGAGAFSGGRYSCTDGCPACLTVTCIGCPGGSCGPPIAIGGFAPFLKTSFLPCSGHLRALDNDRHSAGLSWCGTQGTGRS